MKAWSVLICLLPVYINAQVVGGEDEKLASSYKNGKYLDCYSKAEQKLDAGKANAETYLYLSMCSRQMAKTLHVNETNLIRDDVLKSLKFAHTAYKKDEELFAKNFRYINKLKSFAVRFALNDYYGGKFRGAIEFLKLILKFDPDSYVLFIKSVCQARQGNVTMAKKEMTAALTNLEAELKTDTVSVASGAQKYFGQMVVEHVDYLNSNNYGDSAIKIINISYKISPADKGIAALKNGQDQN